MKISTIDLRRATIALLQHLDETEQREFDFDEDFCWDVPADKRYLPYDKPGDLTMGQLSDDWSEVTQILEDRRQPVAYALVWLAAILRRVGEKAIG